MNFFFGFLAGAVAVCVIVGLIIFGLKGPFF